MQPGVIDLKPDRASDGGSPAPTIYVLATSSFGTDLALAAATTWAEQLECRIALLVPHVVAYAEPLECTPALQSHVHRLRQRLPLDAGAFDIVGLACRRTHDCVQALPAASIVVVGGRRGLFGWGSAAQRLARCAERLGHHAIFVSASWVPRRASINGGAQSSS